MTKTTGIRLNEAHFKKLDQMALAIGVTSRNAVIVQLIDNAQVEERTVIERRATTVLQTKNNRADAAYQGQNVNTVGA